MIEIKISEESIKAIRVAVICFNNNLSNVIGVLARQRMEEIQRFQEERKQLSEKFAVVLNQPDFKELRETLEKFIEEINKTVIAIEGKDELRQTWRHYTYKNKLHSRMLDKRILYHNCRNTLKRRYKIEY